ncbi:hypothetical protein BN12_350024 [Nostocoides japonicum T1-X7]|uniref:Uncharacterized protein n=1 Tax=Nostocoides japonicum T1-X7 TaxID=1194083 RepID=A0A077LY38_9MICO|nr:hypothetical protein BN12_350024 [Tetrasphaera japonica T1-X7]
MVLQRMTDSCITAGQPLGRSSGIASSPT